MDAISHSAMCKFQMPNKLHTPSSGNKPIKNVREGGYQKLLAK
jgi:hypothetical protein